MKGKNILIGFLTVAMFAASGVAVLSYDKYKEELRRSNNLDVKIEELSQASKDKDKKNEQVKDNVETLKETVKMLEEKLAQLESNEANLKANAAKWEQNYKSVQSKYDVLQEKIKGISNLVK